MITLSVRTEPPHATSSETLAYGSPSAVFPNSSRQIPASDRAPVITTSIPSDTTMAGMIPSAPPEGRRSLDVLTQELGLAATGRNPAIRRYGERCLAVANIELTHERPPQSGCYSPLSKAGDGSVNMGTGALLKGTSYEG